jgi:ubiquinone/menaquinone biosynthesis C-methylase UbiE
MDQQDPGGKSFPCKHGEISRFIKNSNILDLVPRNRGSEENHALTLEAYRFYALFYAPISLMAYWLIWRGNIRKHIAFFRDILRFSDKVVDIATGDGSLTHLALFRGALRPKSLVCIDLSLDMLRRASKRIQQPQAILVRADVNFLPLAPESCDAITCFGGLNSFTSPLKALKAIAKALSPRGKMRGSALLLPKERWRQTIIHHWIKKGYQADILTVESLKKAIDQAGFVATGWETYGDVLLFELEKSPVLGMDSKLSS